MKTAVFAILLLAALGCNGDNDHGIVPCGQTCFDCAGVEGTRTYEGSAPPVDCSPSIRDMHKDNICYRSFSDPDDHGQPWCFYNCGADPECVRP